MNIMMVFLAAFALVSVLMGAFEDFRFHDIRAGKPNVPEEILTVRDGCVLKGEIVYWDFLYYGWLLN